MADNFITFPVSKRGGDLIPTCMKNRGKEIDDGPRAGDRVGLEARIAEYADYIARVRIVYK